MGWDREILLTRVTLVTVSIEKQKEMRLGKKARSREKLEFLNHLDFKDSKEERYKFLLAPQIVIFRYEFFLSHHHSVLVGDFQ